jgi:sorbitol-specific phosphotransferase system component IIBC
MKQEQGNAGRMTIWQLLRNILPFVLPYKWLIAVTLVLTLIGSLIGLQARRALQGDIRCLGPQPEYRQDSPHAE